MTLAGEALHCIYGWTLMMELQSSSIRQALLGSSQAHPSFRGIYHVVVQKPEVDEMLYKVMRYMWSPSRTTRSTSMAGPEIDKTTGCSFQRTTRKPTEFCRKPPLSQDTSWMSAWKSSQEQQAADQHHWNPHHLDSRRSQLCSAGAKVRQAHQDEEDHNPSKRRCVPAVPVLLQPTYG